MNIPRSKQGREFAYGITSKASEPVIASMPPLTVGDWMLLDKAGHFHRALERSSVFVRKAAGTSARRQLISANVDTVFLVSSMNQDFRLNRLERYLALTSEADVEAVVVLTKGSRNNNHPLWSADPSRPAVLRKGLHRPAMRPFPRPRIR